MRDYREQIQLVLDFETSPPTLPQLRSLPCACAYKLQAVDGFHKETGLFGTICLDTNLSSKTTLQFQTLLSE